MELQDPSHFKENAPDDGEKDIRAAWAIGFSKAAEISNVGLQFVLPVLAGWWADQKLGTGIIGLCVGLALGMLLSMLSLLHLIKKN